MSKEPQETKRNGNSRFGLAFLLTFIIMFASWIILSGRFDLFHLGLGLVSCLLVAYFSSDLLFPAVNLRRMRTQWPRFILYIPWLLLEVFKANLHVLKLVFHPRMLDLIDPRIIKFRSKLKGELALVTFANSITLTPGTITVYVTDYGEFEVHVIDQASAEALPGEMEARIAEVFKE